MCVGMYYVYMYNKGISLYQPEYGRDYNQATCGHKSRPSGLAISEEKIALGISAALVSHTPSVLENEVRFGGSSWLHI